PTSCPRRVLRRWPRTSRTATVHRAKAPSRAAKDNALRRNPALPSLTPQTPTTPAPPQPSWQRQSTLAADSRALSPRLLHRHNAINRQILQHLLASAGPLHRQLLDLGCRAQSEMHAPVVLRQVSRSRYSLRDLGFSAGGQFQVCANAVTIAFRAL